LSATFRLFAFTWAIRRCRNTARGDPHRVTGLRQALARRRNAKQGHGAASAYFDKVKTYGTPDFPESMNGGIDWLMFTGSENTTLSVSHDASVAEFDVIDRAVDHRPALSAAGTFCETPGNDEKYGVTCIRPPVFIPGGVEKAFTRERSPSCCRRRHMQGRRRSRCSP